jgi:hypothetical protein
MNRILVFLCRNKWFCYLGGGAYYIATVVLHKAVAKLSLRIERQMSYAAYNLSWGIFALLALGLILMVMVRRIFRNQDRLFNLMFTLLTFALIGISHWIVLAVNLEYIHVIQFSILVFPLFALTGNFRDTVFWIGILGAIDELYQYYVAWWPHQAYYDFNDISLDIVGGIFMVLLIYLWIKPETLNSAGCLRTPPWVRSPVLLVTIAIIILVLTAQMVGLLSFYPQSAGKGDPEPPILLSKKPPPPDFWSVFEKGKLYHIQGAAEWILTLLIICGIYSLLDWRSNRITGMGPPGKDCGDAI